MNDQDTTQEMPAADAPAARAGRAERLLRSRSDRMLGGVAGGLGEYFDVDPVIFRIGFGVTLFFGGLGALLYLALMIFVPSEAVGRDGGVERTADVRADRAPDRRRDRGPDRPRDPERRGGVGRGDRDTAS